MDLVRIDGRYRLQQKVWSGSFSEIYFARDILTGQDVAIKLEPIDGKHHTLEHEFHVYNKLGKGTGIPRVRWFGTEAGFNAMVIDRLGPSLEDIFVRCHFRFTVKTVALLACQLIRRLQFVHSRNFVHRDLKPSNIIMGVGEHANLVHIVDFGLSKEFRHPDTHQHIPYNNTLGFAGTPTFASIPSHLGLELGRRDDLESLAYLLIYFLRGSLPWQGLEFDKRDLVIESKQNTPTYDLCSTLPVELRVFLEYSRSLSFDEKPDYGYLCGVFDGLLSREGFTTELTFDWDVPNSPVNGESGSPGGRRRLHKRTHQASPQRRMGLRSQTSQRDVANRLSKF